MKRCVIFVGLLCAPAASAWATPTVLDYVPAYLEYHGSGPTAAGSILGYWDLHGYDNLFDASGWEAVRQTTNVQEHISSAAHNAKYDPKPDNPGSAPPDTSIADFFHTSEGPLAYGESFPDYADDAFISYGARRGYSFGASNVAFVHWSWESLVSKIDLGHPMLFWVDANADGKADTFVPTIGYEDKGAEGLWYAAYDGTSESEEDIVWHPFAGISEGQSWGVGNITWVTPRSDPESFYLPPKDPPDTAPVPEPATLLLLGPGLIGLAAFKRSVRSVPQT